MKLTVKQLVADGYGSIINAMMTGGDGTLKQIAKRMYAEEGVVEAQLSALKVAGFVKVYGKHYRFSDTKA